MELNGVTRLRIAFVPRTMHARVALHSAATAAGVGAVARTGMHSPLSVALWYVGGFIGFHFVLLPFVAAWFGVVHQAERWLRAIVEEELIRFDLQTYQRQLQRVFPHDSSAAVKFESSEETTSTGSRRR